MPKLMDILSDIIHTSGLRRRLLDSHALSSQDGLRFPCERSLGLHAVTRGQAYVHAPDLKEPLALQAGDLVLMARGSVHTLSLSPRPPEHPRLMPPADPSKLDTPPAETSAHVISAAYQLWHAPLHPVLRQLPAWHVLPGHSLPALSPLPLTLGLLDRELHADAPGHASAAHGLLDALIAFTLREVIHRTQPDHPSWSHAINDRAIREALTLMHQDLPHGWTLDTLGHQVGLSRSALAERFRDALGDTPLNHLRTLRMQKAMQLLCETTQNLEQIAQAVGYRDAFGFSKVFKRTTGQSPRQFREQDALDRRQAFRFQAT